jgi:hypothetical protein
MKLEKDVSVDVLDFKFIWSNGYCGLHLIDVL